MLRMALDRYATTHSIFLFHFCSTGNDWHERLDTCAHTPGPAGFNLTIKYDGYSLFTAQDHLRQLHFRPNDICIPGLYSGNFKSQTCICSFSNINNTGCRGDKIHMKSYETLKITKQRGTVISLATVVYRPYRNRENDSWLGQCFLF